MQKKYNLESYQKNLFRTAKNMEFEIMDFRLSTDFELTTLPIPKSKNSQISRYTAIFFCRKKENHFIYKVIFNIENSNVLLDMPSLRKKLEVGARALYQLKIKTKDPFKYLQNIKITDD